MNCPGCQKQLRVPVRPGKTLRVTCPRCRASFDIKFTSPVKEVFKYDKSQSAAANLALMLQRFKALPANAKLSLVMLVVSLFLLVAMIVARVVAPGPQMAPVDGPQQLTPSPGKQDSPGEKLLKL